MKPLLPKYPTLREAFSMAACMAAGMLDKVREAISESVEKEIPVEISEKLLDIMSYLNLSFGGIDLAFSKGEYYFIEVNPTGEWGWLVRTVGLDIPKAIVDWMVN